MLIRKLTQEYGEPNVPKNGSVFSCIPLKIQIFTLNLVCVMLCSRLTLERSVSPEREKNEALNVTFVPPYRSRQTDRQAPFDR